MTRMAHNEKEKKQLMIVGALAVVMLGVGAFSFLGGGKPKPAVAVATKEKAEPVQERDYGNESGVKEGIAQYAGPEFPERDPFNVPGALRDLAANVATDPKPRPIGGGPAQSVGNTQPVQPTPPTMTGDFSEPTTNNTTVAQPGPATKPVDTEFKPTADNPGLTVVGVIQGDVPSAVLQDHGGKQFFVKLGSEAFDARLITVATRHVVIEYGGKKHILHLAR